jgi:hypothetical protein
LPLAYCSSITPELISTINGLLLTIAISTEQKLISINLVAFIAKLIISMCLLKSWIGMILLPLPILCFQLFGARCFL